MKHCHFCEGLCGDGGVCPDCIAARHQYYQNWLVLCQLWYERAISVAQFAREIVALVALVG